VAQALTHHLDEAAAFVLERVARIELDRAVAAQDLPVGAAHDLAAQTRPRECTGHDVDDAPLAERRGPHVHQLADLGRDRHQKFERRRRGVRHLL
jgi:hypothetical protein